MENHPNCVLLGSNAYRRSESSKCDKSLPLYFQNKRFLNRIPYEALFQDNHFIVSSVMIRRSVLKKSGLFKENLSPLEVMAEDYELWLRIGALGEIWNLTEPCLIYRETPLTYYSKLNRKDYYKARAYLFDSALKGADGVPSPLTYPENKRYADICRRERDFCLSGPPILRKLARDFKLAVKKYFFSKA